MLDEEQVPAEPAARSLRAQRRADKREEKANLKALMRAGTAEPLEGEQRSSTVPVPKRLLTPSSRFASRTGQAS